MKPLHPHQKRLLTEIIVTALMVICVISIIWFVNSTRELYQAGDLQPRHEIRNDDHHPVTVDSIQSWMTFNYLDVIFNLPPNYLQTTLSINDPRYPNIRIDTYAKRQHLTSAAFLQSIRTAIVSYAPVK